MREMMEKFSKELRYSWVLPIMDLKERPMTQLRVVRIS